MRKRGHMNRVVVVFLLLVSAAAILAVLYAKPARTATPMPKILNFVTSRIGTGSYAMGSGFAAVLSTHLPTEVKVVPTTGARESLPMFVTGEADLGCNNNWDCREAWLGGPDFKEVLKGKRVPIRLLTGGRAIRIAVIVAADSGIMTGKDLKGKKYVGTFAGSVSITKQARAALANFGLTPADVRMITVPSVSDGVRALIQKRADASGSAAFGMGVVKELEAKRGARYLSFDPSPEAVKRYQEIYPAVPVKVQPRKGVAGIKKPIYMMQFDYYLYCHKKLTDETTYQIVKTLWDYNKELIAKGGRLREWTTEKFVNANAQIPYHAGVVKFYKEKGLWTNAVAEQQQKLLRQDK